MNASPSLGRALGGIWRLTIRQFLRPAHWLTVAGMAAALGLLFGAKLSHANGSPGDLYLRWISGANQFYVTFLVPIIAFISGAGAMRDELKPGSVDYLFTRPIRRWVFLGLKYLVQLACVQADYLVALGVLIGLGLGRGVPGVWAAVPLLVLAQFLMIAVFTAFGFLCGVLTSRYIVIGLAYAFVVEAGIGRIPTELNRLSMTHDVRTMLDALRIAPVAAGPGALATAGTVLAVSAVMVAAAAAIFSLKELAGAKPSDA